VTAPRATSATEKSTSTADGVNSPPRREQPRDDGATRPLGANVPSPTRPGRKPAKARRMGCFRRPHSVDADSCADPCSARRFGRIQPECVVTGRPLVENVDVQFVRLNVVGRISNIELTVPESHPLLCSPVINALKTARDGCHRTLMPVVDESSTAQ